MARPVNKLSPEQVITDIRRHVGHFREAPYSRLGDADSAHGVLFGTLSNMGSVAVKPFGGGVRARGKAARESTYLERIADAGFEALEPLAVAEGGLSTYLITRRRIGLRHLGQVKWGVNVASRQLKQVVAPTLVEAASTLADWHNAGFFRGDARAKNMAYDKKTGKPVFIDAESAQVNPKGNLSVELGNRDIGQFGGSVLWRGLLEDRSPSYRAGFLDAHLLEPYLEGVKYPTHGVTAEARQKLLQGVWIREIEQGSESSWVRGTGDGGDLMPPAHDLAKAA